MNIHTADAETLRSWIARELATAKACEGFWLPREWVASDRYIARVAAELEARGEPCGAITD